MEGSLNTSFCNRFGSSSRPYTDGVVCSRLCHIFAFAFELTPMDLVLNSKRSQCVSQQLKGYLFGSLSILCSMLALVEVSEAQARSVGSFVRHWGIFVLTKTVHPLMCFICHHQVVAFPSKRQRYRHVYVCVFLWICTTGWKPPVNLNLY